MCFAVALLRLNCRAAWWQEVTFSLSIHQYYLEGDLTLLARGWAAWGAAPLQSTEGSMHQVPVSLSPNICAATLVVSAACPAGASDLETSPWSSPSRCRRRSGTDAAATGPFYSGNYSSTHWDCHLLPHFCTLCAADIHVLSLDVAFWWLGAALLTGSRLCRFQDPINSAFSHTEPWDFYGHGTKMHK